LSKKLCLLFILYGNGKLFHRFPLFDRFQT
jgi:hypothetical protein